MDAFTLPLIFALGTGLPVLVFTYLLAFSFEKVGVWFNAIQKIEKVPLRVGAISSSGAYYLYVFLPDPGFSLSFTQS